MLRVEKNNSFFVLTEEKNNIPDFLVKTTLYCSIIAALFLVTFIVKDWLLGEHTLAIFLALILSFSLINIGYGLKNKYNLFLNSYIFLPLTFLAFLKMLYVHGSAATYWPFMLVLSGYFTLPSKRALIYNIIILIVFISHGYMFLEPESALRFGLALFGTSLFVYFGMSEIEKLHATLKFQAVTDPLTGLFNRSLLDESLNQSIGQNQRTGIPMTLVSLDIDHFKTINDKLGHDIGDVVLKRLGELLRKRVRSADRIFRIGGEEFLILLHNANTKRASELAEALRLQIEIHEFIPLQTITMSFGVAELEQSMSSYEWLKKADVNLYKAKEAGRNCVVS
jgi:diguanylate cyclase (GGDEF)-like protein